MDVRIIFRSTVFYPIFALASFNLAYAQTLSSFKTSEDRVPLNTPVTALVEFQEADRNWCGFYIDWGDGKEPQSFRIGRKPDLASPVSRQRSFDKPGTYTLKAYGAFVSKGLQSAEKCAGTLQPITVTVFDPAEEKEKETQEAARIEAERKKLEEERLILEAKAKEIELEKERMKDPKYLRQKQEEESKRIAEEKAQRLAEEKVEKARLAEEAKQQKARIAEEKRLEKEKARIATANAKTYPTLSGDPESIGICMGFLGMEIRRLGSAQALHPTFKKYIGSHNRHLERGVSLMRNFPSCFREGADITSCMKDQGLSKWNIDLMNGQNRGIQIFKMPGKRAVLEAACMG